MQITKRLFQKTVTITLARSLVSAMILLLLGPGGHAQTPTDNQNISRELLKDLQHNINDSTQIQISAQQLKFNGQSEIAVYLTDIAERMKEQRAISPDSLFVTIPITLQNFSLILNRDTSEALRNTRYVRQLDLKLTYHAAGRDYTWEGRVSDKLSKADIKALLNDPFPGYVIGDYTENEPSVFTVVMTVTSLFSLVAVLYFIRT